MSVKSLKYKGKLVFIVISNVLYVTGVRRERLSDLGWTLEMYLFLLMKFYKEHTKWANLNFCNQ